MNTDIKKVVELKIKNIQNKQKMQSNAVEKPFGYETLCKLTNFGNYILLKLPDLNEEEVMAIDNLYNAFQISADPFDSSIKKSKERREEELRITNLLLNQTLDYYNKIYDYNIKNNEKEINKAYIINEYKTVGTTINQINEYLNACLKLAHNINDETLIKEYSSLIEYTNKLKEVHESKITSISSNSELELASLMQENNNIASLVDDFISVLNKSDDKLTLLSNSFDIKARIEMLYENNIKGMKL